MAKEFNWHIEWRDPNDLTPYGYNAKLHDPEQVKNIANSISRFGWQQPAVATKDGTLIIGHGRRLAAIRLGVNMPVKVIEDELSETDIRELRIADNKTNESPWDFELLREEIKDLGFEGFDFDFMAEVEFDESGLDQESVAAPEYQINIRFDRAGDLNGCKDEIESIVESYGGRLSVKAK